MTMQSIPPCIIYVILHWMKQKIQFMYQYYSTILTSQAGSKRALIKKNIISC